MDVEPGNRTLVGNPLIIITLIISLSACVIAAVIMGFDGFLVLGFVFFMGNLLGFGIKEKIDVKQFGNYIEMLMSYKEAVYSLNEQLQDLKRNV